jgi:hypothetical protein
MNWVCIPSDLVQPLCQHDVDLACAFCLDDPNYQQQRHGEYNRENLIPDDRVAPIHMTKLLVIENKD